MHISLTDKLETMVKAKVQSGDYNNASEVIREALRLMRERDEERQARYNALKNEILLGVEAAENGNFSSRSLEQIASDIEARNGLKS